MQNELFKINLLFIDKNSEQIKNSEEIDLSIIHSYKDLVRIVSESFGFESEVLNNNTYALKMYFADVALDSKNSDNFTIQLQEIESKDVPSIDVYYYQKEFDDYSIDKSECNDISFVFSCQDYSFWGNSDDYKLKYEALLKSSKETILQNEINFKNKIKELEDRILSLDTDYSKNKNTLNDLLINSENKKFKKIESVASFTLS